MDTSVLRIQNGDSELQLESFEPVKKKTFVEPIRSAEEYNAVSIRPRYYLHNVIPFVVRFLLYEELQRILETGDSSLIFVARLHVIELITSACREVEKEMHYKSSTLVCRCGKYYKQCKSPINPVLFPKIKILNIRRTNKHHPFFSDENMSTLLQFKHLTHLNLPILKVRGVTKSLPTTLVFLTVCIPKMPKKFDLRHLVNLKSLFINSYFYGSYDLSNQLPSNLSHLKIHSTFGKNGLASLPSEITHLEIDKLFCSMSDLPRKLIFLRCTNGVQFASSENPPPQWEALCCNHGGFGNTENTILPHTVTDIDFSGRRYKSMEHDCYSVSYPTILSQFSHSSFQSVRIIRSSIRSPRLESLAPSLSSLRYLRLNLECLDARTVTAPVCQALKNLSSLETLRIEINATYATDVSNLPQPLDMFPNSLKRLELTVDGAGNSCSSFLVLSNIILPDSLERINILRFNHHTPFEITAFTAGFELPSKLKSINAVGISSDMNLSNKDVDSIECSAIIMKDRPDVRFTSSVKIIPRCRPSSYSYPACSFDDFSLHSYEPWGWEFYDIGPTKLRFP